LSVKKYLYDNHVHVEGKEQKIFRLRKKNLRNL